MKNVAFLVDFLLAATRPSGAAAGFLENRQPRPQQQQAASQWAHLQPTSTCPLHTTAHAIITRPSPSALHAFMVPTKGQENGTSYEHIAEEKPPAEAAPIKTLDTLKKSNGSSSDDSSIVGELFDEVLFDELDELSGNDRSREGYLNSLMVLHNHNHEHSKKPSSRPGKIQMVKSKPSPINRNEKNGWRSYFDTQGLLNMNDSLNSLNGVSKLERRASQKEKERREQKQQQLQQQQGSLKSSGDNSASTSGRANTSTSTGGKSVKNTEPKRISNSNASSHSPSPHWNNKTIQVGHVF